MYAEELQCWHQISHDDDLNTHEAIKNNVTWSKWYTPFSCHSRVYIQSFWENISLKNILQNLVSQATVLVLERYYKYMSRCARALWSGIIYMVMFLLCKCSSTNMYFTHIGVCIHCLISLYLVRLFSSHGLAWA